LNLQIFSEKQISSALPQYLKILNTNIFIISVDTRVTRSAYKSVSIISPKCAFETKIPKVHKSVATKVSPIIEKIKGLLGLEEKKNFSSLKLSTLKSPDTSKR